MPHYIRAFVPGGTFFFTVALLERRRKLLTEHIDLLREVFPGSPPTPPLYQRGHRHFAGSLALHLDVTSWGGGFLQPLARYQSPICRGDSGRRETVNPTAAEGRTGHLAAAVLGTRHPG
jgi:hypothetical protein